MDGIRLDILNRINHVQKSRKRFWMVQELGILQDVSGIKIYLEKKIKGSEKSKLYMTYVLEYIKEIQADKI